MISVCYAVFLSKHIRENYIIHYLGAIILTILQFIIGKYFITDLQQNLILANIFRAFTSGIVGTTILMVVMFVGALNSRYKVTKKIRAIRKELSIIGCYLLFYHIFYYTMTNISVFNQLDRSMLYITISGLIAFAIMLPLFITSFTYVRKKFIPKTWKKIQKWAYLFYYMIYVHMIAVNVSEDYMNTEMIALYTDIFGLYLVLRVIKHINQKKNKLKVKA